jgi:hypothetical protein
MTLLTRTPSFQRAGTSTPNESIDRTVFDQILELDEEDEIFSKDMADAYFVQADKTFNDMDDALCVFAAPSAPPPSCIHRRLGRGRISYSCLSWATFSRGRLRRLVRPKCSRRAKASKTSANYETEPQSSPKRKPSGRSRNLLRVREKNMLKPRVGWNGSSQVILQRPESRALLCTLFLWATLVRGAFARQLDYIRRSFTEYYACMTFFVCINR